MFVVATYYDKEKSRIRETIESITKFHPKEKVIICDSDSPDKSYADDLVSTKVKFFDAKNKRRPFGALMETYKKYPKEKYYVLVHDTVNLNSSIQEFIDADNPFTVFGHAIWPIGLLVPEIREEYFHWMHELMRNTDYDFISNIREDQSYSLCFGSMGIYKNELLKTFFYKGLYEHFNSYTFNEGQFSERAIGYIAKIEGIDVSKHSIEGDVCAVWDDMVNGKLKYFRKTFGGR